MRQQVQILVPDIPNFDLRTNELVYPKPFTNAAGTNCALYNEQIVVNVTNMLNEVVPANKFKIVADFEGTTIEHIIDEEFAANESKDVTFDARYDFSAPISTRNIDFEIYTEILDEPHTYRGNDTIEGDVNSMRTAPLDTNYFTSYFSLPYTIDINVQSGTQNVTQFYYYEFENSPSTMPGGNNVQEFDTDPLFDTITYYVAARTPGTPGCTTDRFPVTVYVEQPLPLADLASDEFLSPISYTCGLTDASAIFTFHNAYWTPIPGGTFQYTMQFSPTVSGTKIITNPIDSAEHDGPEIEVLTLSDTIHNLALSSPTENRIYDYKIFTHAVSETARVVTFNDTISGALHVPATPEEPATITYNVPYGQPHILNPGSNIANNFFTSYNFFNADGDTLGTGTTYATEPIFENTTFPYTGRIESEEFNTEGVTGTASSSGAYPFVFTQTASQGMVLYEASDLGGYAGTIDTIALYVNNNTTQGSFPVKLYLKNTTRTSLSSGNYNWPQEKAEATIIFDGLPVFEQGWMKFPIDGGFYFEGDNLLLMTEHDCYGLANVVALGLTAPTFRYTSKANRVLYNAGVITGSSESFTVSNQRPNLKYYINYACPSPQSTITLTTNLPSIDLHVLEAVTPLEIQEEFATNEVIRVKIANHGSTSASGFTVSYQLDGGAVETANFTGNIAAGSESFFNFPAADLSTVYFPTPLKIFVSHNNDNFESNDTLTLMLSRPDPCTPKVKVGPNADDGVFISQVNFANGAIENIQTTDLYEATNDPYDGMYGDYTEEFTPAEVILGQTYPMWFSFANTNTTLNSVYRYIFVDFNRDARFSIDELVYSNTQASNPSDPFNEEDYPTSHVEIAIPADAELGETRMRIVVSQTNLNITNETSNTYAPCANFQKGEIEDYALNVQPKHQVDPGLLTPIHPLTNLVCPDENGHIKILLKNNGEESLTFTEATPATVTATITGPNNGTYTTVVNNAVTLAPEESMRVVIDGAEYTEIGRYEVNVTLTYDGDDYLTNNEYSFFFRITNDKVFEPYTCFTFDTTGWAEGPFLNVNNDGWYHTTNRTSWTIDSSTTVNGPDAGPEHDHTLYYTYLVDPTGKYAALVSEGSSVAGAVRELYTPCLNMHYKNQYPAEVSYWKHIFGEGGASIDLEVAVGSGTDYEIIDEVEGPTVTSTDGDYTQNVIPLDRSGIIDRVGRIRFTGKNRVGGASAPIDIAIDDIAVQNTVPDIGVEEFLNPQNCGDGENDTIPRGSTIIPEVLLKNHSLVPVYSFTVTCQMRYPGGDMVEIIENWNGIFLPGDEMVFTFATPIEIPTLTYINRLDFQAFTSFEIFPQDKNPLNDRKNAQPCATTDIADFANEFIDGVYLGQNEPNPAVYNTVIPYAVPDYGTATLEIHTLQGQLIMSEKIEVEPGEGAYELNTANFTAGMYLYTFYYKDVKLTKKMIIGQ